MNLVLLTFALTLVIFITGFVLGRVWIGKPLIEVKLPAIEIPPVSVIVDLSQVQLIPSPLAIQFQALPPDKAPYGAVEEVMPLAVYEYCELESEEFARDIRKRRARKLRTELGSWELALEALRKEDNLTE